MKLAVVVQRYGPAVNGGAELHARYIAERLARHAEVEVLTTCAVDYVTWRNELDAGVEKINGVPVRRFRVKRERDPSYSHGGRIASSGKSHSIGDELDWLDAEGPATRHRGLRRQTAPIPPVLQLPHYHAYRRPGGHPGRFWCRRRNETAIGLWNFPPLFRSVRAA